MRDLFESTVERLFGDLVTPELIATTKNGEWPTRLWDAIEESGFSLAGAPESSGGSDAGWGDLYVILRATGRYSVPAPLPEALLANWLLGQASLQALSGPVSFAADATLTLENDLATGTLRAVPWGRHAKHVVAVSGGTTPHVIVLDAGRADRRTRRLNLAGEPRDDLLFLDAKPLMSAPLPAHLPPEVLLYGGAMVRSAQIAGAMGEALDMTCRYATERSQFGRPIAGFQVIQHRLALLAEHVAGAMIASEAACCEFSDRPDGLQGMAAKIFASDAAGGAADTAHAVHGAIGITEEFSLHFITQRLWSWRSEFGSSTFWGQRIGKAVCAGGAQGFWPALTDGG
jgi:acyl-CoA dehydrogenase